uniref:Uncharacterized protein n=1 Tax=Zea mays TaxID=4577 RepID=B7ZZD7_MAIZE|nr:unknown [Zea mays]
MSKKECRDYPSGGINQCFMPFDNKKKPNITIFRVSSTVCFEGRTYQHPMTAQL